MNSYSQVPEAQGVFAPGFHGDGSGLQMKVNELRATGQTFNLVQLLECTSADTGYIEFKLELWFRTLNSEINYGTMQCLKPPGLGCEYGLFRYDPGHPLNIPGTPEYQAAQAESLQFEEAAKQQEWRAHQGRSFW
jgi:hypothetical protein